MSIFAALATLALATAFTGLTEAQEPDQASEEIGTKITAAFDEQLEPLGALECSDADLSCLSKELIERYRVDQWARGQMASLEPCGDYADTHRSTCFGMMMGSTVFQVDLPNTVRLKEIIALHGWPAPPTFSTEAQNAAWYIAQHGQVLSDSGSTQWDADFAESILPNVRSAVEKGELTPWHYAAMYDRIERTRGRAQRFATQIMCDNGKASFGELEDEARIDEFRAEIGMEAFEAEKYDAACAAAGALGEASS